MQSAERWRETVEQTFSLWLHGVKNPRLTDFVREEMGSYGLTCGQGRRAKSAAAILAGEVRFKALVGLHPALPVVHLCAQPDGVGFLAAQQAFASEHPWFQVKKLDAHSHFQCSKCPATLFKPSRRSWQSPPDLTEAVRDSSASAPRRSVAGQAVARVSCPWVTVSFHAIACQCKSWTNQLQIWDNRVLSLQV